MTTKALIEELHRLIDSKKNDEAVLHEVYGILKEDADEKGTDWWDEMTDEQRAQQEKAEEDIKLGKNLVSHEEAMKRAKKWLD